MAAFCLRHAGRSNGVSALHGVVSQDLFGSLDEGSAITSVTNGVHARTWLAPVVQDLLDLHVGTDFSIASEDGWQATSKITDAEISTLRTSLRSDLVSYLANEHELTGFDPNVLTIGFARRFATYKRAALLLKERDALIELLNNDEHPVQFVFAGKAHPADTDGQKVFQEIAEFGASPEANGRFILVPGYDISVAAYLYGGCDVWLNNPVRPQEACGTSGEKSALNGGLNCSILDGWWAEWYHAENGWAIKTSDLTDPDKRDAAEAKGLIKLLAEDVIPLFYDNTPAWNQRIRFGWQYLGPRVTAARMVKDYDKLPVQPALQAAHTVPLNRPIPLNIPIPKPANDPLMPDRLPLGQPWPGSPTPWGPSGMVRVQTLPSSPSMRSPSSSASLTRTATRHGFPSSTRPRLCSMATCLVSGPDNVTATAPTGAGIPSRGTDSIRRKLMLDPYAMAIDGQPSYDRAIYDYVAGSPDLADPTDSACSTPKSIVVNPYFDWGNDRRPKRPRRDTLIYEAHVKGFTALHPLVPEEIRGTYAGLAPSSCHRISSVVGSDRP